MKKLSLAVLLVLFSACKGQQFEGEAIHATVVLDASVSASCVLFEVRDPSHTVLSQKWLPRSDNDLQIAIFRGDLPTDVELAARPYQDGDCSGGTAAKTPNGVYATVAASFVPNAVTQANALALHAGQDGDGDGYVSSGDAGGADCNDSNGSVNPGHQEQCTDLVDLNCDGKKGCEAATCGANACQPEHRLKFTSAEQTVIAGSCSQEVRVESQDAQGHAVPVSAATTIALQASPSTGFKFYSDANCNTEVTSVGLAVNESTAGFYFKSIQSGAVDITAAAPNFASSTQTETIKPAQPSVIKFAGPTTSVAGGCSQVVASLQDSLGNATTATTGTTINLTFTGKTLKFFSDSGCSSMTTSVSIPQAEGAVSFYYQGAQPGASTLTGSSGTLAPATLNVTITVGPPSVLVFTSVPPPTQVASCSAVATVELRDSSGNPVPVTADTVMGLSASPSAGFQFFSGMNCSGGAVTTLTLPTGASSASFYFKGTHAGSVTLTVSVGALSKNQDVTLTAGPPTVLALSPTPLTMTAGDCKQVTLQVQDSNGNPSNVTGNQVMALEANPATGFAFFSDNGCSSAETSVTVNSTESSALFYVRGQTAGSVTVTATNAPFSPGTLPVTVSPAAPTKIAFQTLAQTVHVGVCSSVTTVEVRDTFNNPSPVGSDTTISLSGSTGNTTFYRDSGCTDATSSVTVQASHSSVSFYFKNSVVESVAIKAETTTLGNDTQTETIDPIPPTALVFTTGEQSVKAGVCSGTVTVQTRGQGNPTTVLDPLDVGLASSPASVAFYDTDDCGASPVTKVTIPAGAGTVDFYFKSTTVGGADLTASANGLTSATQHATITAGDAEKIAFSTSSYSTVAGACSSKVSIQSVDGFGNASAVASDKVIDLSSSGSPSDPEFKFYSDASCSSPIGNVTIQGGQSTAGFYYQGHKAQVVTLTAGGSGLASETQNHTIVPDAATHLVFTTAEQTLLAGTCALATVESRDRFDNVAVDALTVNLSGSTLTEFFSTSGCATPAVTQVPIAAGDGAVSFYFKGYKGGSNASADLTLTASSSVPTPATQIEHIIPTVRTGTNCSMAAGVGNIQCDITPPLANLNKAFLVFQATSQNSDSGDANVRCRLGGLSQVLCDRGSSGGAVNVSWSVAEIPEGVATQSFDSPCTGDTTVVPFTNSVTTDRSFLLLSSERNVVGQDKGVSRLAVVRVPTQAEIGKTAGTGCAGGDSNALQVIDYTGASVQRELISLAGGSTTAQKSLSTAVPLDRSILLYSYTHDSTTTHICDRLVRGELTNGGAQVTFTRGDGDTSNACKAPQISSLSYEVVQFPMGTVVQQKSPQMPASVSSAVVTLSPAVDPSRTLVIAGGQWASGQVQGESRYSAGETIAEARARASLSADGTTLTLTRESTHASATFTVYVVQLKP